MGFWRGHAKAQGVRFLCADAKKAEKSSLFNAKGKKQGFSSNF